ncbi:MAG: phosphonate ABC transporter, permease protein PhnE [Cyanophyceae cyanobacterium]
MMTPPHRSFPQPPLKPRLQAVVSWGSFGVLLLYSAWSTGFSFPVLVQGIPDFVRFFGNMWPPDWRALPEIITPLVETLQTAYLGTVFGTLLAMPLIFLSSRNTTPNGPLMWLVRGGLTVVRSVPDLLYAAVLVGILSFGPLPGMIALVIFTTSVLAKLGSETVEAIDPGPLEALQAVGANRLQQIVYGVIPQVSATLTSYVLYIFEINVRASTVLGFVGAGGIGQLLRRYLSFFDYQGTAVLLLIVFGVVLIIDSLSAYLRTKLI